MLVGLLFATIAVLFPVTAQATPSPTADTGQAQAIGNCLKANKVWVFVITAEDKVLANQCVSSPASGADALKKAGVAVQKSKTGLICTMNDHPATCPKSFNGQYWAYYHASKAGATWDFSQKSADQYKPTAGSIEGWCYNKPKTKSCTPPKLAAGNAKGSSFQVTGSSAKNVQNGDASSRGLKAGPLATIIVIAVVAIAQVFAFLARPRPPPCPAATA